MDCYIEGVHDRLSHANIKDGVYDRLSHTDIDTSDLLKRSQYCVKEGVHSVFKSGQ